MSQTYFFHGPGGLDKAWRVWRDPLREVPNAKTMICCGHQLPCTWVIKHPRAHGTPNEPTDGTNVEVYLICDRCQADPMQHNCYSLKPPNEGKRLEHCHTKINIEVVIARQPDRPAYVAKVRKGMHR